MSFPIFLVKRTSSSKGTLATSSFQNMFRNMFRNMFQNMFRNIIWNIIQLMFWNMFRKREVARVPLLLDVLLTKKMGEDIRVPLGKEGCPLIEILL